MKTLINIGTDKGNITNVQFDKSFRDITYKEIKKVVLKHYGKMIPVQGWSDVTK